MYTIKTSATTEVHQEYTSHSNILVSLIWLVQLAYRTVVTKLTQLARNLRPELTHKGLRAHFYFSDGMVMIRVTK